jgi:hypothetical protein
MGREKRGQKSLQHVLNGPKAIALLDMDESAAA